MTIERIVRSLQKRKYLLQSTFAGTTRTTHLILGLSCIGIACRYIVWFDLVRFIRSLCPSLCAYMQLCTFPIITDAFIGRTA